MKRKFKVPHAYVIIFALMILAAIATYIMPAGSYARYVDEDTGRTLIEAGSYERVENTPVTPFGVLQAVPEGLIAGASITFMVFVYGGAFGIINKTGAIESGINHSISKLRKFAFLLIPALMAFFAVMGGFLGLAESTIIFIPIGVTLARALGFDAIVGYAMVTLSNTVGFTAGPMNLWSVGVAQDIAELPLFSGFSVRMALFVAFYVATVAYILLYASKIRKDPTKSLLYDPDNVADSEMESQQGKIVEFTTRKKIALAVFGLGFIALIVLILTGMNAGTKIAAYLLGLGIVIGIIDGENADGIAKGFVDGCRSVTMAALVVGIARAVLIILENGNIVDTILYAASGMLENLGPIASILLMFAFQFLFNFVIISGSGQAAVTMPLMVPMADIAGVTRQSAVLAFQMGDGLSNSLWPSSGTMMAGIAMAGIPYQKWVRWLMCYW